MKDYSASQIKKGLKIALNQYPKEGTKVRELFDLFHNYKGQTICFESYTRYETRRLNLVIRYLEDFYGMRICNTGLYKWRFIGEYISGKYVSYEGERKTK